MRDSLEPRPAAADQTPSRSAPSTGRREFLARAAAVAATLSLGCSDAASRVVSPGAGVSASVGDDEGDETDHIPHPERSGIEHVVVVMMENRSFDHFLGWVPKADGRQAGLVYYDRAGVPHETHPLAPDYQGCGHPDPDHSYEGGREEYDGGRCDGWLRAGENDDYAIGYYTREDLAFFSRAVPDWTTADRYFTAMMGPTYPNRIYQFAAQTDRIVNTPQPSVLPTIFDRLLARGLTALDYFSDLPSTALWGYKYAPLWRPIGAFFADAAAGQLPNFSWIDPRFLGENDGTGNDDHPYADIRAGEDFLNRIYNAVTTSPAWRNTVLVINYDEWGGFFDHVAPPTRPVSAIDRAAGYTDGLLGFRTPFLIVSPFARRGFVAHQQYDHTSVLRMVEWRWGLEPLTERDRTANNLARLLRLNAPPRLHAPQYLVPPILGGACPGAAVVAQSLSSGGAAAAVAAPPARAAWRELASRVTVR